MTRNPLRRHVFGTYASLRLGMVVIGAALPIAVAVIGALYGVALQPSISEYYWSAPDGAWLSPRDVFVGCLCAVAACLWLYKGFTTAENAALNLAGLFGVGVAIVPTAKDPTLGGGLLSVHGTSAILLFLCLVFVVWFCAGDTLKVTGHDPATAAWYKNAYRVIGLVMLASPLTAFVLNSLVGARKSYVFFVETAGIWAFAAYWFFKGRELARTNATRRALRSRNENSPEGVANLPELEDEPVATVAPAA